MKNNGKPPFLGPSNLNLQGFFLVLKETFVPIQVKAYLPYGNKWSFLQPFLHDIKLLFKIITHITGMQSHHGNTNTRIFLFCLQHWIDGFHVNAGLRYFSDARITTSLNHFLSV